MKTVTLGLHKHTGGEQGSYFIWHKEKNRCADLIRLENLENLPPKRFSQLRSSSERGIRSSAV
jgi:hypothetical protein